jgi:putative DNA primase/helicase
MEADRDTIRRFIERLHGPEPEGWLVIWTRQDQATRAFDLRVKGALDQAVDYCAAKASIFDVYAAVGLQQHQPVGTSRGDESGVSVVPGFFADVDIQGPSHKAKNLPPTERDARSLIESLGLEPSIIVRSGFGLQPYWLFREPYLIENDDERQRLKSLSVRFQQHLRLPAKARGWTLDSTADLCRVLRVGGTFNHKVAGDVRLVTVEYADHAYNLFDFDDLLVGIDDPGEARRDAVTHVDFPPAKLPQILEGCPWMRHCQVDAASLSEPDWYHMLTVVARCEDPELWAHELSKPYPQYSSRETQQKLRHAASNEVAPVTCAYVQSDLGGEQFCRECLFRGNVNSPIRIGRIEALEPAEEKPAPPEEPSALPVAATGTETSMDPTPNEDKPPSPEGPPGSPVAPNGTEKLIDPEPDESKPESPEEPSDSLAAAIRMEKFTDLGNARRLMARNRDTIIFCPPWNRFLFWESMLWTDDNQLEIFARAADLIRSLYPLANRIKDEEERNAFLGHLRKSESHRAQHAMVTLAKADRGIARQPDDFDNDPWLLTVMNGTIDLRTGNIRPHNPKDMITKLAPVIYDPSARCPNFLEFLDMIMLGRKSLIEFLKRAIGLSLTGITSDKVMFILYGPGGDNGKSTLVEVIEMLLGTYAKRTPVATFLKKREGGIPNDIARLKGARFVWASESDRGVRLSESLIKEMTGGDKLVARFLHGEFFEFMPKFKIWLATNHKPNIRGDAALWQRLKLVPFEYTIPKDRQKKRHEVMAMFRAELPGILNWAIEGCVEWQRDGLGVPEEVVNVTREYEAEQDTFSAFLEETCVRTPNAQVLSMPLYRKHKMWCEEHGELPVTHKTFAAIMSERGFKKTRTRQGFLYSGIGLRSEDHYDMPKANQLAPGQPRFDQDEEGEEV